MALADDLSLNGDSYSGTTEGALIFKMVGNELGRSYRRVSATAMTTPQVLTISHQSSKKSGVDRVRSLIRLDEDKVDAVLGNLDTEVHMVIYRPIKTDVTPAQVKAMIGRLIAATQVSGMLDAILNGET